MTCTYSRPFNQTAFVPHMENIINVLFNSSMEGVAQKENKNRHGGPAVNVKEKTDRFEVEISVPGLTKKEISVTTDNDILKVEARANGATDVNYSLREFNHAGFAKNFYLPDTVDPSFISAKMNSGVLTLTLGKKKESIPQPARAINIK